MSTFWQGVLAVVLGGALSLMGVALTLRHQTKLARQADERALRDRKHERLRAAYRDVVAASDNYVGGTWPTFTMFSDARREGLFDEVMERMGDERERIQQAHALLRLESDEHRAVLGLLEALVDDRLALLTAAFDQPDEMPFADFERGMNELRAKAEEVVKVARGRLAELENPV